MARLAVIRETGWALSRGEYVTNVAGISSAVFDAAARQTYAFGVALPAELLSEPLVERYGAVVRDAAANVGKRIGDAIDGSPSVPTSPESRRFFAVRCSFRWERTALNRGKGSHQSRAGTRFCLNPEAFTFNGSKPA